MRDEDLSLIMETIGLDGFRSLQRGGDISVEEAAAAIRDKLARGEPLEGPEPPGDSPPPKEIQRLEVISAPDLLIADLPPIKFLVDDILPEGTSLFTAASKIGKSWMVLDEGMCIAAGEPFMGHATHQCGVLYLALEDSYSRLQDRMRKVLNGKPAPPLFDSTVKAPTLDNGLLDTLEDHLQRHPDTKLFIIDTLQKIRGQAPPREGAYARDYREMGTVKEFMDKHGLSVQFLHHNRKMRDDGDPFNMISGTNALMGAADTIWTITKDKRAGGDTVLHITGRDVEQSDAVIKFDNWRWQQIGAADWLTEQRARQEYDGSPIVKTIKKLLEQSPAHRWDGTATELLNAGKYIARTYLAASAKSLGREINSLEKPLFDYDGIVHASSPTGGKGGKRHSFYYQDLSQFGEEPAEQGFIELPEDGSTTPFDPAKL